jgi:hypothetical protein
VYTDVSDETTATFFILSPSASFNIKVSFDKKIVRDGQEHILVQERQCTYNVTLKSVLVITVVVEKHQVLHILNLPVAPLSGMQSCLATPYVSILFQR